MFTKEEKLAIRLMVRKELEQKMLDSVQGSDTPGYRKAVDFYLKQFDKTDGSSKGLLALRNRLYPQTLGTAVIPSARQAAVKEMYTGLNSVLRRVSPEADDLIQFQPQLQKALTNFSTQANKGARVPILGQSQALGRPLGAARDLLSRGAEAGSRLGSDAITQPTAQFGGRAITGGLGGGQQQQQSPDLLSQLPSTQADTGQPSQAAAPTAAAEQQGPDMQALLRQMAVQDMQTTGGKNISKIIALAKFLESEKPSEKEAKISSLSRSVDLLMENHARAGGGRGVRGLLGATLGRTPGVRSLGLDEDAQVFEDQRKALIAPLARAISGEVGVLTDRDIARAEGLLPRLSDPTDVAQRKAKDLQDLIAQAGSAGTADSGILQTGNFFSEQ